MGTLQYPRRGETCLLLIGNDRTSSAESSLTAAATSVRPLTTDGLQEKLKELVVRAVPRSERRTGSGEQRARTFNSTAYSTMYSTTASSTFRRCNGVASEQICKCVGSLSFFLCWLAVIVDVAGNVTRLFYDYWTVLAAGGYFLSTVALSPQCECRREVCGRIVNMKIWSYDVNNKLWTYEVNKRLWSYVCGSVWTSSICSDDAWLSFQSFVKP